MPSLANHRIEQDLSVSLLEGFFGRALDNCPAGGMTDVLGALWKKSPFSSQGGRKRLFSETHWKRPPAGQEQQGLCGQMVPWRSNPQSPAPKAPYLAFCLRAPVLAGQTAGSPPYKRAKKPKRRVPDLVQRPDMTKACFLKSRHRDKFFCHKDTFLLSAKNLHLPSGAGFLWKSLPSSQGEQQISLAMV